VSKPLPDKILDAMAVIGDPRVDPDIDAALTAVEVQRASAERGGPPPQKPLPTQEVFEKGVPALAGDPNLGNLAEALRLGAFLAPGARMPGGEDLQSACRIFARYGSEIAAALLLAALPEAYAGRRGARLLKNESPLAGDGLPRTRRISATSQFVITVMSPQSTPEPVARRSTDFHTPDSIVTGSLWGADGPARHHVVALRVLHAMIRTKATDVAGMALNQEDLLAMLLTFTVTVFDVLRQFGISISTDDQDSYFVVWDFIGDLLGIGSEDVLWELLGVSGASAALPVLAQADRGILPKAGKPGFRARDLLMDVECIHVLRQAVRRGSLRPASVEQARTLLAQLHDRLWVLDKDEGQPPYPFMNFRAILDDVEPGRILLRSLLDEFAEALPPGQQDWPVELMRQMLPVQVRNRLALGGPSVPPSVMGTVSSALSALGLSNPGRMSAEVLRRRALQVTDALLLEYLRKGLIDIPGLDPDLLGVNVSP
jgi:ER-bound oxygenase mpaB/B'/Rubber oxygenase, catalytic domain